MERKEVIGFLRIVIEDYKALKESVKNNCLYNKQYYIGYVNALNKAIYRLEFLIDEIVTLEDNIKRSEVNEKG